MGGKRSDQHKIDPEGSSSDASRKDAAKIPTPGVNPAEREHRERKAREALEQRANRIDRRDAEDEKADERVDEASRDSFPASDPPSIP